MDYRNPILRNLVEQKASAYKFPYFRFGSYCGRPAEFVEWRPLTNDDAVVEIVSLIDYAPGARK